MFEVNGIALRRVKNQIRFPITDAKVTRSFNDDCDIFRR